MREWLAGLDAADRRIVGMDIATVEFGWPIGMPICRPVGRGIFEVRSTIRSGKVEARTYFAAEDGQMLLLHGADGKDRQQDDVELAMARFRDHRHGA